MNRRGFLKRIGLGVCAAVVSLRLASVPDLYEGEGGVDTHDDLSIMNLKIVLDNADVPSANRVVWIDGYQIGQDL